MVTAIQCRIHAPDAYPGSAITNRRVNALRLRTQVMATKRRQDHWVGSRHSTTIYDTQARTAAVAGKAAIQPPIPTLTSQCPELFGLAN
jgi:hypothetical protein